jgi:ketosteroid isomerase-like protein
LTSNEARAFAAQWAEAWNNRNIEQVLAHFREDVEFTSPTAQSVMGVPTLRGKGSLREYWTKALARIAALRFTMDRIVWDPDSRELAIIYVADIDGKTRRVSENLRFDSVGQVVAAEVFHGVAW